MATSILNLPSLASALFEETAIGATVLGVKTTSATIKYILVDNTANGAASFLKLFDATSGSVTLGTTAPDAIFKIAGSAKVPIPIPDGWVFASALSVACVTTGGTAGVTPPSSNVIVRIAYN